MVDPIQGRYHVSAEASTEIKEVKVLDAEKSFARQSLVSRLRVM